jgi:tetratricopeptide (TPR) repeat protein
MSESVEPVAARIRELVGRYEAVAHEEDFLEARRLCEEALALSPEDPGLHLDCGYLLECQARNQLRRSIEHYERAIGLDPRRLEAHYQLIGARAALREPEIPVAIYERRLEASPQDADSYRLLATAYLFAHRYENARRVVEAGLALGPDDARLIERRGELRAGTGDPDGALADWRRALELDPDNLSPLYSSAFLLEREGRPGEAAQAWRRIVEWHQERGFTLEAQWPRRELGRLEAG